ncbi:Hint domain-containing protein [Rhodovulum euryhalinum]|uniref:Hint domain-containing protein n=1 Tax=Rhodovulum euryhalinum TaxID=35805 RepID=A0A4V2SAL4_9RHOB|nr:Hint domain-containing protein [Rhodovulum euryhalinum]TCO72130.1 Hint domain-containing protein [Rhodovulum euryhalinum]
MATHDRHDPLAIPTQRPTHPAQRGPRDDGLPMRRYEVHGLCPDGYPQHFIRALPAEPHVDEAFAAFAHGTLIATPGGPVAVEDLAPGMTLATADAGARRLMWAGSTVLMPMPGAMRGDLPVLTRVTADSLGLGRPAPDLILGPRARMLFRHPGCHEILGTGQAFGPAAAFVDGVSLIGLRITHPIRVFHLALEAQHILIANGIEVESYHPGDNAAALMDPAARQRFLALFPHLCGFEGFGPMTLPRLTAFEMERMRTA